MALGNQALFIPVLSPTTNPIGTFSHLCVSITVFSCCCFILRKPPVAAAVATAALKYIPGKVSLIKSGPQFIRNQSEGLFRGESVPGAAALLGPLQRWAFNSCVMLCYLPPGRSESGCLVCRDPKNITIFPQVSSTSLPLFLSSQQKGDAG